MKKTWGTVLVTAEQIQRRLRTLGRRITRDFSGEDLVLVAVLKGSFVFLGDLIRQIKLPLAVDFVEISSYGAGTVTSRKPRMIKDATLRLSGRNVLIVDDILDSGHTLRFMLRHLKKKSPKRIKTCVLLEKKDRREVAVEPDYAGFAVGNHFVVGYGLDYQDGMRHLPFIAALEPKHLRGGR